MLVIVWGLRMFIHISCRTKLGKEDRRFVNIREAATPKLGGCGFELIMWFVFVINAGTIMAINGSALTVSMLSA